jgi:hypothetical protein
VSVLQRYPGKLYTATQVFQIGVTNDHRPEVYGPS